MYIKSSSHYTPSESHLIPVVTPIVHTVHHTSKIMAQPRPSDILPSITTKVKQSLTPGKPVYMLVLMKYRETATYHPSEPDSFHNLPKIPGREAFLQRYITPWMASGASTDAEVIMWGAAKGEFVKGILRSETGEEVAGEWDDVALLKYGSFEGWVEYVESEKYRRESMPHKLAALEDERIVAVEAFEFP